VAFAAPPIARVMHAQEHSLQCSRVRRKRITNQRPPPLSEVARRAGSELPEIRVEVRAADETPPSAPPAELATRRSNASGRKAAGLCFAVSRASSF
jgi:hypothetical protein